MTLELFNDTTSISRRYSREFLGKALELARLFGWRPLGTRLKGMQALWNGTYLTNDGQMVLIEDALSLADAIEKALDDIPNESRELDWNPKLWVEDDLPEWLSPEEKQTIEDGLEENTPSELEIHPFEFFAGNEKQHLVAFIRFCRLGSFIIW